jgi:hypothetical protein
MKPNKYLHLSNSIVFILVILFPHPNLAQYKFESTYGGYGNERGNYIRLTNDGGYIITGETSSFSSDQDMYLLKIDKYSNLEWSKVYHQPGYEEKLHGVIQNANNEYYVVGFYEGGFGFLDNIFMKVDLVGNIIWAKNFGGIQADELRDVCITQDGRILAVGQNASFGAGAKDFPVIKFTSEGNIEWAKTFGNVWEEFGGTIIQLDNGNLAFLGATDISGFYDVRPLLFKTDSQGNLIWAKIYPGYLEDWGRYGIKTQDNGFLIVGDTRSYGLGGSRDIYVIKAGSTGNVEWAKAYGGINDESGYGAVQNDEGNFVITGFSNSFGQGGYDAILMEITPNGNLVWFYTYGGLLNDYAYKIVRTSDSGYVMTGGRSSNSLGGEDILLIKVDKFGISTCQNGPFNPNVFNITNLVEVNYNLFTTNVISTSSIQLTTIAPNSAQNFICGIVPVELESFNYEIESNGVILLWSTITELNNYGFEVERCSENHDWRTIGFIEGKGTKSEIQNYSYYDDLFGVNSEKVFYRLKQIDFNGQFNYSSELEVGVPAASFNLSQNFPNPFNPVTVIKYSIPKLNHVSLIIYNSLGQQVRRLVDEIKIPGYYQAEFDAADLPGGVYFYSLLSGEYSSSKKMVLIK